MPKARRERRTLLESLACRSCGGREFRREGTLFTCLFCGAESQARRISDALCGEGGGSCREKAHRLCASCGLPLCARHDDPKIYYWRTSLEAQTLCPQWDAEALADWEALQSPLQRFPLVGFEPFPWVLYGREAAAAVATVESRLFYTLKPLATAKAGSLGDSSCPFECLCEGCFSQVSSEMEAQVVATREEYKEVAVLRRLEAMAQALEQDLAYVGAWIAERSGGDLARKSEKSLANTFSARDFLPELNLKSPLEAWRATEAVLAKRLKAAQRLGDKAGL